MLTYRRAGLSTLGAHCAGVKWRAMRGRRNTAKACIPPSNAKPLAGVRVTVLPTFPR
jgi:hypothetical protein